MKVLSDSGSGSSSGIIAALDEVKRLHLAKGDAAKSIISMSLGGTCSGSCSTDPMVIKIQELASVGIVSSVAAGNSNEDTENHSPAAAPDALTVGSTDDRDAKSSFSNFGSLVDIQAPGSSITSACSRLRSGCEDGESYWTISGTSMACPHVTGVAAQHLEKAPTFVSMTSLAAVNGLRSSIMCDSVSGKITGVPGGTTASLLQAAKDDGLWACESIVTVAPTTAPSGPSEAPTTRPTSTPTELVPIPSSFPAFTATNTNSARQNTVDEDIFACPGTTVTFSLCSATGASCSGDTYLRLYDNSGAEVAKNDDGDDASCGSCSSITRTFTAPCQKYTLAQGCFYNDSCGGAAVLTVSGQATSSPTVASTAAPTAAVTTAIPTAAFTNAPVAVPTRAPTNGGTEADCPGPFPGFNRCEQRIVWQLENRPDRWFESRGLERTRCSVQGYFVDAGTCPALVTESPVTSPTNAPIAVSSTAPTVGIPDACTPYAASNTNSGTENVVQCPLLVCPGTILNFKTCSDDEKTCSGDTFLRLVDAAGNELASNDDNCGLCSRLSYEFTGTSCEPYFVNQGCYGDSTCSGTTRITRETSVLIQFKDAGSGKK